MFCRAQFINDYADTVFSDFYSSCFDKKDDKKNFIECLASHYADLNALHPFREGNGRTQREFTRELCIKCGYVLDLTRTKHDEMLSASIKSFDDGDNTEFILIFEKCVVKKSEYKDYQSRLSSVLLTLSDDDI